MSFAFFAVSELNVVVGPVLAAVEAQGLATAGPWRPSEWVTPALTSITVPSTAGPATPGLTSDIGALPGAPALQGAPARVYMFDAVLHARHQRRLRKTEHPVQAGSTSITSVADHAYRLPASVTLEIGMSDAMASYSSDNWTGNASKSVAAYQTLVDLQESRTLVTLTTRLDTYQNMLIEDISPVDNVKTRHGLRATVTFSEIFLASVTAVSSGVSYVTADPIDPNDFSLRPALTGATPSGVVQSQTPSNAINNAHSVPTQYIKNIPGAGAWSGLNVSRLAGLIG